MRTRKSYVCIKIVETEKGFTTRFFRVTETAKGEVKEVPIKGTKAGDRSKKILQNGEWDQMFWHKSNSICFYHRGKRYCV